MEAAACSAWHPNAHPLPTQPALHQPGIEPNISTAEHRTTKHSFHIKTPPVRGPPSKPDSADCGSSFFLSLSPIHELSAGPSIESKRKPKPFYIDGSKPPPKGCWRESPRLRQTALGACFCWAGAQPRLPARARCSHPLSLARDSTSLICGPNGNRPGHSERKGGED